jgi:hypothetical protein
MKTMDQLLEGRELRKRPLPLPVAVLFALVSINITATVLSLLAAFQG